ncbi:MAG: hypothetical protein CMP11_02130 [Zetaproteobacteria bacterium]|nr:hypothetical protein [Pseudobdellovibrionaceae bacterium]
MLEFLSHPIIGIVLMLGILIFVHEFGHYIAAKACGVGVEVFSIGFGPNILSFTRKGTLYQIACIPLGGFVKLAGASPIENVPSYFEGQEMYKASLWKRAFILFAGPFANFLLAGAVYTGFAMNGIEYRAPVLGWVKQDSPADKAGLLPRDQILSIDGKDIKSWADLEKFVSQSPGKNLRISFLRDSKKLSTVATPAVVLKENHIGEEKNQGRLGILFGFISPVVTVSESNKHEIKTGASITKVSYESSSNIYESNISTWDQFLKAFQNLLAAGSKTIDVFTTEKNLKKLDQTNLGNIKKHTLFIGELYEKFRINKNIKNSLNLYQVEEFIAENYGLHHSLFTIEKVEEPADKSLKVFDRIIKLGNKKITDLFDLIVTLEENNKSFIDITAERQGNLIKQSVELRQVIQQKASGKENRFILPVSFLGVTTYPDPFVERYDNIFSAASYGLKQTLENSAMIVKALAGIVSGSVPVQSIGGPILIAKVAGDSVKAGWDSFLRLLALISINLWVVNLIPIPILDGGQLVLVAVEAIRRRPLSQKAMENFQKLGFIMIMALVVLSTYNDLNRFWTSILSEFVGYFK